MSWPEFIASLVQSLAWPVIVVVLSLVFRKTIMRIVTDAVNGRHLKKAKLGPIDLEWATLDEARANALASDPETAEEIPGAISENEQSSDLLSLAEVHPSAAIMLASQQLEGALLQSVRSQRHDLPRYAGIMTLATAALRGGIISGEVADLVKSLSKVRNQVAHAQGLDTQEITPARAADYVATTRFVIETLQRHMPKDAGDDPHSGQAGE
ncbi:hypothetical protein [Actinoplanes regularis]|uniref:hypothetical protein n=1 Tax=Actinoplanes regularis TaxID=52697 RepID=UPI001178C32E|nr:hypothetical protein [Actinoplanes regularis]GIE90894.1 hypothetical protein Are01nite_73740 [Actinoplanes regularis]